MEYVSLDLSESENPTVQLTSTTYPEDALDDVKWSTSDKTIATVDENGLVTLLKPGTATIKVTTTDGSNKSSSVKLAVYYVDTATKLTATAEVPTIGLQPGQKAKITVTGSQELPQEKLSFSIPDNQQHIATVDENTGIVTAGYTPGTVTVTAAIRNDPLKRTATVKIKVIAMQAKSLEVSADVGETAKFEENTVILDALTVKDNAYTFTVSATGKNHIGGEFTPAVTWASSNTAIATVKTDKDGITTVTVKKGAGGECAITATAKDLGKASASLWLSVRDYSPRLESSSLSMNLCQSSCVDVALMESYGNKITDVSIDGDFDADWNNGILTITAQDSITKGSYTPTLTVTCENEATYEYPLKIKVTETAPTVTIKQSGKYNLFYSDGTATLNITAKDGNVEAVTVLDGNFSGAYENGVLTLTANAGNGIAPAKKVTLSIRVAGYEQPVRKEISLSTVTTAPKLKLSSASSVINTSYGSQSTTFQVLSGTEVLDLTDLDVTYSGDFAECSVDENSITLELNGTKGGTATLNIQKSNWTKSVKLTHKVTVQTALPTMKLNPTTLKLNSVFPELSAETTVSLSQANLELTDMEIISKTNGADDVLDVDFVDGKIVAKIKEDSADSIKAGTYTYTCTGYIGETELKAVTLKVTVSATSPKVKLASTTFKLNRNLAGEESISTKVTVPEGYELLRFDGGEDFFSYEDGYLTASLTSEEDMGGTFTICPVLLPDGCEEPITLSTGLKVKVTTYSAKVTATVSTKGKLDVLDPYSAITYTVKLKNCAGTISDDISLSGQDEDLFDVKVLNGNVILTMKNGEDYATNKTYKVNLDMIACGQEVSKAISFKVSQSALKLTATPSSLTCYQAIGYGTTTLKITSPATAEIADVTLGSQTTAALQKALGEDGLDYDFETGKVTLTLQNPGLLTPGKSYTLYLDVTPKGNAENVKPTQVKLTVKVKS